MKKENSNDPITALICGSRDWTDEGTIAMFLASLPKGSTVIHGACRGADKVAGRLAKEFGLSVEEYPADWDTYGLSAGPIRNRQMLADGDPDIVVAFHDDIESSKGTKDMVRVATNAGVPVAIFTSEDVVEFSNDDDLEEL